MFKITLLLFYQFKIMKQTQLFLQRNILWIIPVFIVAVGYIISYVVPTFVYKLIIK